MNKHLFKPVALGVALALGAGSACAASNFDTGDLDKNIIPCQDFDGYVNAKWLAANPIPADRSSWGAFDKLAEDSLNTQHQIVEEAAKNAANARPGSIEQKIGWYYKSGMDAAAINKAGFDPIKPELAKIDALKSPAGIVTYIGDSFSRGLGDLFSFGRDADFKRSERQIAYAFQGGLSLPTRDYYTKTDADSVKLRHEFTAHVAKMFELTGVPAADARRQAKDVLAFETRLAKASLAPVDLRKPENQYHFVSVAEADKVTPRLSWDDFIKAQGANVTDGFSLSQPAFFAEVDKMLGDVPVSQWQSYLRYHLIENASPVLSDSFQNAHFEFYGKTLVGQKVIKPRWKRVLGEINSRDSGMGMALGELYVAKEFPPEAKQRAMVLVDNVRNALKTRIENLDWMSAATKRKAIEKWNNFLPKIGYPDKWRDWSGLTLTPGNYYANVAAATKFNYRYEMSKVGTPTDRHEWGMTPQTVNAYYNPTDNTINFPAAILQPPFFYASGDDAINYGGIGAVIGHEASHGYDDEGSQFDAKGNNVNWWTKADRAKFDARTQKLVEQFDGYSPLPGVRVNGRLTLGENIGDLGGLSAAYDALQVALKQNPKEAGEKIDGGTQDQRFFLNWARVWRENMRPELTKVLVNSNPHAPSKFRAIGAPSNMASFASAFQCKAGDKMVRSGDKQVNIW